MELDDSSLPQIANNSRITTLKILSENKSPHVGSCFSVIDILVAAFDFKFSNSGSRGVDVLLSKGHAAAALYAVLFEFQKISKNDIDSYGKDGSSFYGHVDNLASSHIPLATGSLGHGLPFAVGLALSAKLAKQVDQVAIVILSDGELDEGTTWESLLIASQLRLDNLIVIVDRNFLQSFESTEETLALEPLKDKFESFGWIVRNVDGHDIQAIQGGLRLEDKPLCLIAKTTKGKGVSFMENSVPWHYKPPIGEEYDQALTELERLQ
jgi:transketolase